MSNRGTVSGAWGGAWYWEGLNIFTNFLLIFFIPPYLAALVLSIVAMAQRRIG